MSDKASDKRYRITLTERQLALVGNAVELMMRTGMGQTMDLAEWITLHGNDIPYGNEFDMYLVQRNMVKNVLDGIMREIHLKTQGKSDVVMELTTLYEAISHTECVMEQEPSEDVKPVVHAHWIDQKHGTYKCSSCGQFLDFRGVNAGRGEANYCPNCGADMRGEQDG